MSKPRQVPLAGVGRQQAAEHADGRGLAAAVGAEEAADRAARHLDVEIVDDGLVAEALGQALDVGWRARRRSRPHRRDVDGLAGMQRLRALVRPGLDHEHQPRALLAAVDHRRRVFGLRRDEADGGRSCRRAQPSQADLHRLADRDPSDLRLRHEEADLHVRRRQQLHDRLARRPPSRPAGRACRRRGRPGAPRRSSGRAATRLRQRARAPR